MKLKLKDELKQLNYAAESLLSNDFLRNAEIRNIQAIIKLMIAGATDEDNILIEKYKVEERINELADRPEYAGKHEKHRNN